MREDHVLDPRSAGEVERFHTWPVLRRQNVASHSWQVCRILLTIWPHVPQHVLTWAVWHDAGEVWGGDPPYHAKRKWPDGTGIRAAENLKASHDAVEVRALEQMSQVWGFVLPVELNEDEQRMLKVADVLEMWEFALREVNLGNMYCALVRDRCQEHLLVLRAEMAPEMWMPVPRYFEKRYEWEREIGDGQ